MFDTDVKIYGKHSIYMKALTAKVEDSQLFNAAYFPYRISSVIGYLYGRKSEPDKSMSSEDFQILYGQIQNIRDDLFFNYRLIMLLDKTYEPDFQKRINNAFYDLNKKNEDLFNSYILGGIEKLYEMLVKKTVIKSDDYIDNIQFFVRDFNEMFNKNIDHESIIDLCRKLKNE